MSLKYLRSAVPIESLEVPGLGLLAKGVQVTHSKYGDGVVTNLFRFRDGKHAIEVKFETHSPLLAPGHPALQLRLSGGVGQVHVEDGHTPSAPQQEPTSSDELSPESRSVPRLVQIIAGLLLLPLTLLCTAGAVTIFGIPKVESDPFLQFVAALISLLCLWTVTLAVRLVLGLRGKGLMGPVALRIAAAIAIGLVVGGLFTSIWVDHPFRSAALSIFYVLIAVKFWKLAAQRSRNVA